MKIFNQRENLIDCHGKQMAFSLIRDGQLIKLTNRSEETSITNNHSYCFLLRRCRQQRTSRRKERKTMLFMPYSLT